MIHPVKQEEDRQTRTCSLEESLSLSLLLWTPMQALRPDIYILWKLAGQRWSKNRCWPQSSDPMDVLYGALHSEGLSCSLSWVGVYTAYLGATSLYAMQKSQQAQGFGLRLLSLLIPYVTIAPGYTRHSKHIWKNRIYVLLNIVLGTFMLGFFLVFKNTPCI